MTNVLRVVLGVHAHWTGAQWSSVDDVLSRAVELSLATRARHGAACAVDFDGRGLEEAAARTPRVLERLRRGLDDGSLELSGASFAQPVAGLCMGESLLRQRVLGLRAVERLLGRRPRALWEGAPLVTGQFPQILAATGIAAVGLVPAFEEFSADAPEERRPWLAWKGLDDTTVAAVSAHALSLAFARGEAAAELDLLAASGADGVLLAWVPHEKTRAAAFWRRLDLLRDDERFEFRPTAFQELVRGAGVAAAGAEVRYAGDEFFHGAAPAKNGDLGMRSAAWCEEQLLAAESLAALVGRLADPQEEGGGAWPAWELEEAWRELCVAQHHAIAPNETLLAGVAECSVERSLALSQDVHERTLFHLSQRVEGLEGGHLVLNPLGWERDVLVDNGVARAVPAFGYRVVDPYELEATPLGRVRVRGNDDRIALVRGRMRVEIDKRRGVIEQITTRDFPEGLLDPARPLLDFVLVRGGREEAFETVEVERTSSEEEETDELAIRREARGGATVTIQVAIEPLFDAVWLRIQAEDLPRPDPGAGSAFGFALRPRLAADARLAVDHPYGVGEIAAVHDRERRVPRARGGSEPIDKLARPFTALRFVDLYSAGLQRGMLYVHDGSPSFSRVEGGVRHLLSSVDPFDEDSYEGALMVDLWVIPHAGMDDAARMRRAMECTLGNPRFVQTTEIQGGGTLPGEMGALHVSPDHVLATAFWREAPNAREHLERPLIDGSASNFAVRLVEFAGRAARVRVRVAGKVERAARTDVPGEVQETLAVERCDAVYGPAGERWSELTLDLRAHEIATVRFV